MRKFIPAGRWTKLRSEIIAERGQQCETCGIKIELSHDVQAHEVWSYNESAAPAVAHLTAIELSCRRCHSCEHWGRLELIVADGIVPKEAIDEHISHFCYVNGVKRAQFALHRKAAFADWRRRSELDWRINWGPFADVLRKYHPELPQPDQLMAFAD